MEISRRGLLGGFGALVAAPYVVRNSGLLMPVRNRLESAKMVLNFPQIKNGFAPKFLLDGSVMWMPVPDWFKRVEVTLLPQSSTA